MHHQRVESSNIYSLHHTGDALEARFKCARCKGVGVVGEGNVASPCPKCSGAGHTGTYVYPGVPEAVFHKVMKGEPVENAKPSIGVCFNVEVKSKYKGHKKQ